MCSFRSKMHTTAIIHAFLMTHVNHPLTSYTSHHLTSFLHCHPPIPFPYHCRTTWDLWTAWLRTQFIMYALPSSFLPCLSLLPALLPRTRGFTENVFYKIFGILLFFCLCFLFLSLLFLAPLAEVLWPVSALLCSFSFTQWALSTQWTSTDILTLLLLCSVMLQQFSEHYLQTQLMVHVPQSCTIEHIIRCHVNNFLNHTERCQRETTCKMDQ